MTKQKVLQLYNKIYYGDFDIELYKNTLYFYNTLWVNLEIPYQNNEEKRYIYKCLKALLSKFDFSFTVEYHSIEDLKNCSIIND